ncbi:hypothetical protein E3O25_00195 [Cryobacterium sp. TMT1-3]|uniref:hypothetical protein n=1 Tax=Cryobacterium sp. TMT1-3 TaxID=1259237 RepID=UPI00106A870E|nr:hypothetical protein [Cryobacterium sp. TMT1-3]TFC31795.1 hypothetical protein E3O25_00195 [Cryobacterium sp. TMT1-3]
MPLNQRQLGHPGTERGSALMGVIGVMGVLIVITLTLTTATLYSLDFTRSTRASVQSVAAAESGVSAAQLSLTTGTCRPAFSRSSPQFTAAVSYSVSGTGDAWVAGCPPVGVPAVRLRVESTGSSLTGPASDEATVEAIFDYESAVSPGVQPSGAAMYLHGGVVFMNNANLLVAESGRAAIQVKNGNVSCSNNTVIEGDVVVAAGNLNISGCSIEGNAWASGAATLGAVTGNLTAASVNLTAAQRASRIGGVYTRNTVGTPIPTVPAWVDLNYVPSDWVDANGLPYRVAPIGLGCTIDTSLLAAAVAVNGGKPIIINALALCPLGVTAVGTVKLPGDVVIFANKFTFVNNVQFQSSTTARHKLWFITPDLVADQLPTCGVLQGDFWMKNSFTIAPTLDAMTYTPCRFNAMNNFEWRGQLYANGANDFKNNTRFESAPLGLPGIDLETGTVTGGGSAGAVARLGNMTSMRDLNDG